MKKGSFSLRACLWLDGVLDPFDLFQKPFFSGGEGYARLKCEHLTCFLQFPRAGSGRKNWTHRKVDSTVIDDLNFHHRHDVSRFASAAGPTRAQAHCGEHTAQLVFIRLTSLDTQSCAGFRAASN
jgi:hypothetical protein